MRLLQLQLPFLIGILCSFDDCLNIYEVFDSFRCVGLDERSVDDALDVQIKETKTYSFIDKLQEMSECADISVRTVLLLSSEGSC